MAKGATAKLLTKHPEYAFWLTVFPDGSCPVTSFTPVNADSPDGQAEFYKADISQLSDEQLNLIAQRMAEKFHLPETECLADILGKHGLPLRKQFWSVAIPLTKFI